MGWAVALIPILSLMLYFPSQNRVKSATLITNTICFLLSILRLQINSASNSSVAQHGKVNTSGDFRAFTTEHFVFFRHTHQLAMRHTGMSRCPMLLSLVFFRHTHQLAMRHTGMSRCPMLPQTITQTVWQALSSLWGPRQVAALPLHQYLAPGQTVRHCPVMLTSRNLRRKIWLWMCATADPSASLGFCWFWN